MARIIFHIDINAFYASAHTIQYPSLANKPVAVCSNHRGSVITTASYTARQFGVAAAMPLAHALRLCPDLVVIDVDFELYTELSQRFISIIRSYSPIIQQASIDECYVDVTDAIQKYPKPLDLALTIREHVMRELKLPISIGVAPNKFLAKMASDMQKPNGITVLRIREVDKHLWPLPIEVMHGIGKKTVPRLQAIGIHTIQDLAQQNADTLRAILGMNSQNFIDKANGYDNSPIETDTASKSIGQSKTFKDALADLDEIRHAIMHEIETIEHKLKQKDLMGKTITFSLRLANYKTAARSVTLEDYFDDRYTIFERVMVLYDEFDGQDAITFLSVSISNLRAKDAIIQQLNIFDDLSNPSVHDIIHRLNQELEGDVFKTPRDLIKDAHKTS